MINKLWNQFKFSNCFAISHATIPTQTEMLSECLVPPCGISNVMTHTRVLSLYMKLSPSIIFFQSGGFRFRPRLVFF